MAPFRGVPLGIVFGRFLWNLFAHEIDAVPVPSVPVFSVILIALGALALANIVAAVPGRIAARTPTSSAAAGRVRLQGRTCRVALHNCCADLPFQLRKRCSI